MTDTAAVLGHPFGTVINFFDSNSSKSFDLSFSGPFLSAGSVEVENAGFGCGLLGHFVSAEFDRTDSWSKEGSYLFVSFGFGWIHFYSFRRDLPRKKGLSENGLVTSFNLSFKELDLKMGLSLSGFEIAAQSL